MQSITGLEYQNGQKKAIISAYFTKFYSYHYVARHKHEINQGQ